MKKKKKTGVINGEYLNIKIGDPVIATAKPTISRSDFYKYSDMLYEAWAALSKAGYTVTIKVE